MINATSPYHVIIQIRVFNDYEERYIFSGLITVNPDQERLRKLIGDMRGDVEKNQRKLTMVLSYLNHLNTMVFKRNRNIQQVYNSISQIAD